MTEITKVSSKGQVVIPSKIREELNLEEGSRLMITSLNDLVILKKIKIEDLKEKFKRISKEGEKISKEMNIRNEEDVVRIIHNGRRKG